MGDEIGVKAGNVHHIVPAGASVLEDLADAFKRARVAHL